MFEKLVRIPDAREIQSELPISKQLTELKVRRDGQIREVIAGKSDRLLVIVGPCSAHSENAVLTYLHRLARLNERVGERLVLVPRIYTVKPRTRGVSYKGMFFEPCYGEGVDIPSGIRTVRKLLMQSLSMGLSAADELLYPEHYAYEQDLVSYFTVGTRSSENQMHRLVTSGIEVAVGIKNPMNGSLASLANAVSTARSAQEFAYCGYQVKTGGNAFAHAILRGRVDENGVDIPNYDEKSVLRLVELFAQSGEKAPAVIIDTNHSNSAKHFDRQPQIVREVMKLRRGNADYARAIRGFMIESFLEEGCAENGAVFGKSVTDPCLGWADTERLILELAEQL